MSGKVTGPGRCDVLDAAGVRCAGSSVAVVTAPPCEACASFWGESSCAGHRMCKPHFVYFAATPGGSQFAPPDDDTIEAGQ